MSKDKDVSVGFGVMQAKNQGSAVTYQERSLSIKKMKVFATVDDVIEMLKKVSGSGYGDYVVVCNEYFLAKKGDVAEMDHEAKEASLGGYI